MSLASNVGSLATRVANYLRDSVVPRLIPSGGTTGQALTKSSATSYAVQWSTVAGGTPVKIETFDSSATWTKDAAAKAIRAFIQAGGGGGASGGRSASGTVARGGSPGGAGGYSWTEFNAADLPASVSITVGVGGTGGASVTTDNTAGAAATDGGVSAFGVDTASHYLRANGGGAGQPTGSGISGSGRQQSPNGLAAPAAGGQGTFQTVIIAGPLSGGAGAGQPTTPATNNGTSVVSSFEAQGAYVGKGGTGSTKTNAVSPSAPFALDFSAYGGGGGGGWCNVDGTAGPGSNGICGGGGGGGGGSLNGNPSGKGGNGGNGRVVVVTFY